MKNMKTRIGWSATLVVAAALAAWAPDAEAVSTAYADISLSFTVSSSDGTINYSNPYGYAQGWHQINGGSPVFVWASGALPVSAIDNGGASWAAGSGGPLSASAAALSSTASGGSVQYPGYGYGSYDILVSDSSASTVDLTFNPTVLGNLNLVTAPGDYTYAGFSWNVELYDAAWQLLGSQAGSMGQWQYYANAPSSYSQNYSDSQPFTFSGIDSGAMLRLRWSAQVNTAASTPTPLPDGGLTVALLGSALLGFAGVRRLAV